MSDQDTTIFNSEETPKAEATTEATTETAKSTITDPLSEYVGEGKQYANAEAFAKSFQAKQDHIQQLEQENKVYRQSLEEKESVEALLEELKQSKQQESVEQVKAPEIDMNAIDSIIESKLTMKEQAIEAKANTDQVVTAMQEKFGEKAEEIYNSAGKEIGMSVAEMNALAAKSPKALLKLIGVDAKPAHTPATSTGSINTESLQPREPEKPSARLPVGATTEQMKAAFRAAKPTLE